MRALRALCYSKALGLRVQGLEYDVIVRVLHLSAKLFSTVPDRAGLRPRLEKQGRDETPPRVGIRR